MATQTLWPTLDAAGTSLPLLDELGAPITSMGISVTLVAELDGGPLVLPLYYRRLRMQGLLLDYDPLSMSGDPVSVPAVTRVSSGLAPLLTSQLAARPGLSDGEQLFTLGYSDARDAGGAGWRFLLGASSGANGYTKIQASNGQYHLQVGYNQAVSLRQMYEELAFQSSYGSELVPPSSKWWSCGGGASFTAAAGASIDDISCSWTTLTIAQNSRYRRLRPNYPTRQLGSFNGTIDHDWGNQGECVSLQTSGNVTINAPTNMNEGALYRVHAQQGAGGHTFSFGSGIACTGYSNTGNAVGAWILLEFECVGPGAWRGHATAWS
jgi:hypothetical protein